MTERKYIETSDLNFAQNKAHFTLRESKMPEIMKGFGEFVNLIQGNARNISFGIEFDFSSNLKRIANHA